MFDFQQDDTEYRRLVIYLLLDTSGSMGGAPIEAMNESLQIFKQTLRDDPHAVQTAHISIITFGGQAKQIAALTPVLDFEPPHLVASGDTPLGQAFLLLDTAIDREVRQHSSEQKGDWKPLVFLFTDGAPTDGQNWKDGLSKIRQRQDRRVINIISVGAPGANPDILKEIGGTVLNMRSLSREAMREFFNWVSQSTISASTLASDSHGAEQTLQLPPPPSSIQIVL